MYKMDIMKKYLSWGSSALRVLIFDVKISVFLSFVKVVPRATLWTAPLER